MDFWVAIPDSSLVDEQTRRDKSNKISQIARACSIFRVNRIYVYRDPERDYSSDRNLLQLILEFLDTPPYLRRVLYPRLPELQYAGLLHPLKTPHHRPPIDPAAIRVGDVRQAVIVRHKNGYFADAGLNALVPLDDSATEGRRVTITFTSQYPRLRCRIASAHDVSEYWGYEVREARSMVEMLKDARNAVVVMTSRDGESLQKFEQELRKEATNKNVLLVFGSPNKGLFEMLRSERRHPREFTKYVLNFFPEQGAETVRLEEAIAGCLALLNYILQ